MIKPIPENIGDFLRLDADTGELFWISARSRCLAGIRAGSLRHHGDVAVTFCGRVYGAHRIVWFLATGEQPPAIIDHRDGDKTNNRPGNLREATPTQNNANTRGRGRYAKGVSLHETGKYQAQLKCRGRNHYLGLFATEEEAARAYALKASEIFGEFARAA